MRGQSVEKIRGGKSTEKLSSRSKESRGGGRSKEAPCESMEMIRDHSTRAPRRSQWTIPGIAPANPPLLVVSCVRLSRESRMDPRAPFPPLAPERKGVFYIIFQAVVDLILLSCSVDLYTVWVLKFKINFNSFWLWSTKKLCLMIF